MTRGQDASMADGGWRMADGGSKEESAIAPPSTLHPPPSTRRLGRRVLVFDRIDSTSTYAASRAGDPAQDGLVVLAREQASGRGQHGRSWQCPPDSGVLLSALLFPPAELRRPALLTAWAAVSVCETIHRVSGLEATIKWPNDVLIQGRKVSGILIEQVRGTVAGIGLNLNQTATMFEAAGLPQATSLAVATGQSFEMLQVARILIQQLDLEYDRLHEGSYDLLETRWRTRLGLVGRTVVAECRNEIHRGCLRSLTFQGLELEPESGQTVRLLPELVQHLTEAEYGLASIEAKPETGNRKPETTHHASASGF